MKSTSTRALYSEYLPWGILLAVAAFLRFYELGLRAMSYDEAQHCIFSYLFYSSGEYVHSPVTHGPLLFHLAKLSFHSLGVSDFTARLAPAIAGILSVGMLYCFRGLIGRRAALFSAILLAVSPTFLFYSRYFRNDIYICLFSLVWVLSSFQYMESANRRWLYWMVLAMALAFASKETSFIFGLVIGIYFVVTGWTRRSSGLGRRQLDLGLIMFCLVLPFASPVIHFALGWQVVEYSAPGAALRTVAAAGSLWVVGLVAGYLYLRSQTGNAVTGRFWVKLNLLFWGIEVSLFTTLFRNFPRGLASGITGSLGYWMTQQEVGRGGQPFYYYGFLAVVYEFLPLLLGLGGVLLAVRHLAAGRKGSEEGSGAEFDSRYHPPFLLFLIWWSLASWVLYALAGEKMPWLLTQIMLPMVLLAGWFLSAILKGFRWEELGRIFFWIPALSWAALVFCGVRLLTTVPRMSREVVSMRETISWMAAAFLLVISWVALRRSSKGNRHLLIHSGILSISTILLLLTVRSSTVLSFENFDTPTELLVYAHGTPDIKSTLREIDRLNDCAAERDPVRVAYDAEANLPFGWYLRQRPNTSMFGTSLPKGDPGFDVILVGDQNWNSTRTEIGSEYLRSDHRLISWPDPVYRELTPGSLLQLLADSSVRKQAWAYFLGRPDPGETGKKFHFYVKKDRLRACEAGMSSPLPSASLREVLDGSYDNLPLKQPRAIALGVQGDLLIADSGNHRLVLLRPDKTYLTIGSYCSLNRNPGQGCQDPDGNGPLEPGDGQFDEPWGVALDAEGRIYAADTWNGRIQVFDPDGRFLRKWGTFGATSAAERDCEVLYGPRALVAEPDGGLLLSDTGNKRILRFTPEGECAGHSSGGGKAPGLLDEPVGLALDDTGGLLIADAWNQRIQAWTPDFQFRLERKTEGWDSTSASFKPYLTIDSGSRIVATDPGNSRLIVFDPEEPFGQMWDLPPVESGATPVPTGIVFDARQQALILSDSANGRLLVFDWPPK